MAHELQVPAVLAQLLHNRGIRDERGAKAYLRASLGDLHEPNLLPGVSDAAQRIARAVREKRRIVIYGDYDVDGVCGTSILLECLRLAGADARFYVPHRIEEGYGLNCDALTTLRRDQQADLVVTVDCGIASGVEAVRARELGIELIVTDHHHFATELPAADCLVHPRLPGGSYPFDGLCGAGVAFKLAWAIAQQLEGATKVSQRFRDFLVDALSLAALGTVADVVPLRDENRAIVRHGLVSLQKRPSRGLKALLEAAEVKADRGLSAEDIAFRLAPRINAAGRLGHASLAVELLTTRSAERATDLARFLHEQNEQRQTVERRIFREAKELVEQVHDLSRDRAIVLGHADWHPGVIGIVAQRMVERFWRPCVLVALRGELGQGSGRSIPGFDLYEALSACRESLVGFGGHSMAAGVKLLPANIERFRAALCEHAAHELTANDLDASLRIDAEVSLLELTPRLVDEIESMAPFGAANRRPLLVVSNAVLMGAPKVMGGGDRHMSFRIRQNRTTMRAVAFGQAERIAELLDGRHYDVAFTASLNRYRGHTSVDLHVKDFRASVPAQPAAAVDCVTVK